MRLQPPSIQRGHQWFVACTAQKLSNAALYRDRLT